MTDDLLNDPRFRRLFPPVAAVLFATIFASLGAWQLDRAAEKNRFRALFASEEPAATLEQAGSLAEYEVFDANGRYDAGQQIFLDNIFVEGRIGYFVLTPFQPGAGERWLLVNRGWVPRPAGGESLPDIAVGGGERTIVGRLGTLPRIGIRSRPAFDGAEDWPKTALYPTLDEVATELGLELYPFVMLLSPAAGEGFVRRWEPQQSGPMMHYGYAVQWFGMAGAVLGVLAWHLRRRRR